MSAALLLLLCVAQEWDAKKHPWPMFAQNPQRTGLSPFTGPDNAKRHWSYEAKGAVAINIQAVVTSEGAYFGSWGMLRREGRATPDQWDKCDGRYYGLSLDGKELWKPLLPAVTPVGYRREGRARRPIDDTWCKGTPYLVSYFNGTIEGVPCIDPEDGTHYVGRGDGALYAIDRGRVKWAFRTFNPEDPEDPDGGGEIIGGPVVGPGRVIYFGTAGMPWPAKRDEPAYETNAIYAVDAKGKLVWRYPSAKANLDNWIFTPPALSSDGKTLYVGTFGGDYTVPGKLIAIDLTQPRDAADEKRIRWMMELRNTARPAKPNVYVRYVAVGADGRVYVAGIELQFAGSSPVLFAVDDGKLAWTIEPHGYPSRTATMAGGLALHGDRVYFTTTHVGRFNGDGGKLFAVEAATGKILGEFDAASVKGVGGVTPPTIGADGTVYVGIRGKGVMLGNQPVNGRMVAIRFADGAFRTVWDFEVEGQIDWAPPAIGANGGLYFGTSAPFDALIHTRYAAPGEVPTNTSPRFYGILK